MVEFAFVGVILVMFAFGIIVFGFLLSFKQDVTRAATEGARAGAVAVHAGAEPTTPDDDQRLQAAQAAIREAVDGFGQDCDEPATTCNVTLHDCGTQPPATPDLTYWANATPDCVTVELVYDYASFPLIIDPPLLSGALPDRISATSVARLNQ